MNKAEKKALELELQAINLKKKAKEMIERAERLFKLSDYYYSKSKKQSK